MLTAIGFINPLCLCIDFIGVERGEVKPRFERCTLLNKCNSTGSKNANELQVFTISGLSPLHEVLVLEGRALSVTLVT